MNNNFDNYYKVGGSLKANHPTYITRQADHKLLRLLSTGEFCYVFNSRQTGKSSLRINTIKKLRKLQIKCASVDLTLIGNKVTQEQWYRGFSTQLIYSLELEDDLDINEWWSQKTSLSEVQKLNELFSEIILKIIDQSIIIFIDEIDSLINLEFKDDFLAFIRACYNQRAENPDYNRLTFCLLGVMTPSSLMQDKQRTPFNIGQSIELTGFTFDEAKIPLSGGLVTDSVQAETILEEILYWTGGQPFLTQKVCKLFVEKAANNQLDVKTLVKDYIIDNWEYQDEPEHLKTIRDRLLREDYKTIKLLKMYQYVLNNSKNNKNRKISKDNNDIDIKAELRLSGLVIKKEGILQVYNPIYATIFNQEWVQDKLNKIRPYSKVINQWIDSNYDPKFLLNNQQLETALAWATTNILSDEDYHFLTESQKQIFRKSQQKSRQIIFKGSIFAGLLIIISFIFSQMQINRAQKINQLIEQSYETEKQFQSQFQSQQIDNLITAMKGVKSLNNMVNSSQSIDKYPTLAPVDTLVKILTNIQEYNRIKINTTDPNITLHTITINPQGQIIAVGTNQGTIKLFTMNGTYLRTIKGHNGRINQIIFSKDGNKITSLDEKGAIKIWNTNDGSHLQTFSPNKDYLIQRIIKHNNETYILESENNKITIRNIDKKIITSFLIDDQENTIRFDSQNNLIAIGNKQGQTQLWSLEGKQEKVISGHQDLVTDIAFSQEEKMIATASDDSIINLWTPEGKLIKSLKGHSKGINRIKFSPDSKILASASRDKTIKLWDKNGRLITTLVGHKDEVKDIHFTPDNKAIISISIDGEIKFWKLNPGIITRFSTKNPIKGIYFLQDKNSIMVANQSNPLSLNLFSHTGTLENSIYSNQEFLRDVALSKKGDKIIALAEQKTVKILSLDGKVLNEIYIPSNLITSIGISDDGQLIVVGTDEGSVKIIKRDGKIIKTSKEHFEWVTSVTVSPDGQIVASGDKNGVIQLWKKDGTLLKTLNNKNNHSQKINELKFSPDGKILASASEDQTIKLWSNDGTLMTTLRGHNQGVYSIDFTKNGLILASGSGDQTVKLWRRNGTPLTTLFVENQIITSLNFSSDGTMLMAGSHTGKVIIWNLSLNGLLNQGCQWLKDYSDIYTQHIEGYCSR